MKRLVSVMTFLMVAAGSATAASVLAPYRPSSSDPWNEDKAAHLMRRAGFGADSKALEQMVARGYEASIKPLVDYALVSNQALDDTLRQAELDLGNRADIKAWWMIRMVETQRPLEEKMVLFWHSHFATSVQKVKAGELMVRQNELFRRLGSGDFAKLLLEVSKDPAMIQWLDNAQNRKGKPNENYARELMELFTTGIGHYTEQDIKEAARAFTGWQATFEEFFFNPMQHDFDEKTFMGQRGPWNGGDIVRLLADHPATARRISQKLFEYFAYSNPDAAIVDELARLYQSSGRNIGKLVETILRSNAFYSAQARQAQIKSPVEYVVGTARSMNVPMSRATARILALASAQMGQDIFEPPTVKGWDGGATWINTATLLVRHNFVERLSDVDRLPFWQTLAERLRERLNGSTDPDRVVAVLVAELIQAPVDETSRAGLVVWLKSPESQKASLPAATGPGPVPPEREAAMASMESEEAMRPGRGGRIDFERVMRRQVSGRIVNDWPAGLKFEQVQKLVSLVLALPAYQLN